MTQIDQPNTGLQVLNSSAERRRTVAGKLDDTELTAQEYPAKVFTAFGFLGVS